MKYKIVSEDTIKNLIEFLDEIQFDAAKVNSTEAHHQVNFCNWAINELLTLLMLLVQKTLENLKMIQKNLKRKREMNLLMKHLWIGICLI